jgi:hypothetical protein
MGLGRASEHGLQLLQRVGEQWGEFPALDCEAEWTIQLGELVSPKPLGLALAKPHPRDADAVRDLVAERCRVPSDRHHPGKCPESIADRCGHQIGRIEGNRGMLEPVPAVDVSQLTQQPILESLGGNLGQASPGPAPQLVERLDRAAKPSLIGMTRFSSHERAYEHLACGRA